MTTKVIVLIILTTLLASATALMPIQGARFLLVTATMASAMVLGWSVE